MRRLKGTIFWCGAHFVTVASSESTPRPPLFSFSVPQESFLWTDAVVPHKTEMKGNRRRENSGNEKRRLDDVDWTKRVKDCSSAFQLKPMGFDHRGTALRSCTRKMKYTATTIGSCLRRRPPTRDASNAACCHHRKLLVCRHVNATTSLKIGSSPPRPS
jgi:hypothetical protein